MFVCMNDTSNILTTFILPCFTNNTSSVLNSKNSMDVNLSISVCRGNEVLRFFILRPIRDFGYVFMFFTNILSLWDKIQYQNSWPDIWKSISYEVCVAKQKVAKLIIYCSFPFLPPVLKDEWKTALKQIYSFLFLPLGLRQRKGSLYNTVFKLRQYRLFQVKSSETVNLLGFF